MHAHVRWRQKATFHNINNKNRLRSAAIFDSSPPKWLRDSQTQSWLNYCQVCFFFLQCFEFVANRETIKKGFGSGWRQTGSRLARRSVSRDSAVISALDLETYRLAFRWVQINRAEKRSLRLTPRLTFMGLSVRNTRVSSAYRCNERVARRLTILRWSYSEFDFTVCLKQIDVKT